MTFADLETGKLEQLGTVLAGATAWLAFNVSRENILPYSTAALDAGLKRVLFSLEIPSIECPEVVNIPEFDEAINAFKERNASFTGIRHSTVIDGDENNPYCIVNSTSPTLYLPVNRGVVARVASELLLIPQSSGSYCGLSGSNNLARAYLGVMRSAGFTRRMEVQEMFLGGLVRASESLLEREKQRNERIAQRKLDRIEEQVAEEGAP